MDEGETLHQRERRLGEGAFSSLSGAESIGWHQVAPLPRPDLPAKPATKPAARSTAPVVETPMMTDYYTCAVGGVERGGRGGRAEPSDQIDGPNRAGSASTTLPASLTASSLVVPIELACRISNQESYGEEKGERHGGQVLRGTLHHASHPFLLCCLPSKLFDPRINQVDDF